MSDTLYDFVHEIEKQIYEETKAASFLADGCGSSTVCASFAAGMSMAKDAHELLEITG